MPARDSFPPEASSPVLGSQRCQTPSFHTPSIRPRQGAQMTLHTAGSRIDLPAALKSRLHSSSHSHLSPSISASSNSPVLHAHASTRPLRARTPSSRSQSQSRPMQRHAAALRRPSRTHRRLQSRVTDTNQVGHNVSHSTAGSALTGKLDPRAFVDESATNDSLQQMQELSCLLQQVILLHMAEGAPVATASEPPLLLCS